MSQTRSSEAAPVIRCHHRRYVTATLTCPEHARWWRLADDGTTIGYFCDEHRQAGDQPLPAAPLVELITVEAAIDLIGAAMSTPLSRAEAVARLEAALEAAGARLLVRRVSSRRARGAHPAAPGGEKAG